MEVGIVIAIIQVVDRVIDICKFYVETAKDAIADVRSILVETSLLRTVLDIVRFLAANDGTSPLLVSLVMPGGVMDTCQKTTGELMALLPEDAVKSRGSKLWTRKSRIKTSLAWPLKKAQVDRFRIEIARCRENITLALISDSAQDIKEIKVRVVRAERFLSDAEKRAVLEWLSQTDPSGLHNTACSQYEAGTGDWALNSPPWTEWLAGNCRCLWISGIPGAGKTVLCSHLIEQLQKHCHESKGQTQAAIYYYCYFGHNQDETRPLLRWIIHELCRVADVIPPLVHDLFIRRHEPSVEDLKNGLHDCLALFDTVFVSLDALDESQDRHRLLQEIESLATDLRFVNMQILATSRIYVDIERVMKPLGMELSMACELVEPDIRSYVQAAIKREYKHNIGLWPQPMLDMVVDTVPTKARGMFRWAVCQLDILRHLKAESDVITEALGDMPKDLDATYERIFGMFKDGDRELVRFVLVSVGFINNQPIVFNGLSMDTLLWQLPRCTSVIPDISKRQIDEATLRDICGCLVRIQPSGNTDKDISFAHYTVLEYLTSGRLLPAMQSFALVPGRFDRQVGIAALRIVSDPGVYPVSTSYSLQWEFTLATAFLSIACYLWTPTDGEADEELASFLHRNHPCGKHLRKKGRMVWKSRELKKMVDFLPTGFCWGIKWDDNIAQDPRCQHAFVMAQQFFTLPSSASIGLDTDALYAESFGRIVEKWPFGAILGERVAFSVDMGSDFQWLTRVPHKWSFDGFLVEALIMLTYFTYDPFRRLALWDNISRGFRDHRSDLDTQNLLSYAIFASANIGSALPEHDGLLRHLLEATTLNNSGYVLPLQIAVLYSNAHAVELLLQAGADPNLVGNSNARIPWHENSPLHLVSDISGKRPLEIQEMGQKKWHDEDFRYSRMLSQHDLNSKDANTSVKNLLLGYGARLVNVNRHYGNH